MTGSERLNSHTWESSSTMFGKHVYKCSKCGFSAFGTAYTKPTVLMNSYTDLLSCEEMSVKEILE